MENLANNKRQFNLKDTCIIYVLSLLLYLVLSLVVGVILNINLPKNISGEKTASEYFSTKSWYPLVGYTVFPLSFLAVIFLYGKFANLSFSTILIKDNKFSYTDLIVCIVLMLGLCFGLANLNTYFVNFLNKVLNYIPPKTTLPKLSLGSFLSCFFAICVLPSFCEEIVFRKLFVKSLEGVNKVLIIILTGLLFSLFHFNLTQMLYQFIIGCVFGIVALVTKSSYPTIIMHFLNNFIVLILFYINPNFAPKLWVAIVCTVVAISCIVYFVVKLVKEKQENKVAFKNYLIVFLPLLFTLIIWVLTI